MRTTRAIHPRSALRYKAPSARDVPDPVNAIVARLPPHTEPWLSPDAAAHATATTRRGNLASKSSESLQRANVTHKHEPPPGFASWFAPARSSTAANAGARRSPVTRRPHGLPPSSGAAVDAHARGANAA